MKSLLELKKEKKLITLEIKNIPDSKLRFLIARYLCVIALEKKYDKIYRWFWLLLPNWRYYLRLRYDKNHPRFGRYSNHYWKPDRVQIFKINGYKYHIIPKN